MNIYREIKSKRGYITALAPMEGITDSLFRQMICKIGKPDLFFTEFLITPAMRRLSGMKKGATGQVDDQ